MVAERPRPTAWVLLLLSFLAFVTWRCGVLDFGGDDDKKDDKDDPVAVYDVKPADWDGVEDYSGSAFTIEEVAP